MADYILAKEIDAYNIGNVNIQLLTNPSVSSNRLCTVNKARQLGCTVNTNNTSGITYSNGNQIVCKDDLKYDYGTTKTDQKLPMFNIGLVSPNVGGSIKSMYGTNYTLVRDKCGTMRAILSTTTYSSYNTIPWNQIPPISNEGFTDPGCKWVLFYYYNNYWISPKIGNSPSNNTYTTPLLVLSGNNVTEVNLPVQFTSSTGFILGPASGIQMYLHIQLGMDSSYSYYMNIPVSAGSCAIQSSVFYYNNTAQAIIGSPKWTVTSTNS